MKNQSWMQAPVKARRHCQTLETAKHHLRPNRQRSPEPRHRPGITMEQAWSKHDPKIRRGLVVGSHGSRHSGCLASVSRLRAGPLCNPLAVLAGPFGVADLGPPCNPLALRKGVA